jgi:thioredoxin-dependent peroxiredoxin
MPTKKSPILSPEEVYVSPLVEAVTSEGKRLTKSVYQKRWLVLYFYPRDLTPGCTVESRDFQSLASEFSELGALVLGVSKDSCESHRKFADKEGLSDIVLLSDADGSLCEAFDVWKEKSNYGRKYMGIERSTFLIDPSGQVRARWLKVKVDGHAQAVLETLHTLQKLPKAR